MLRGLLPLKSYCGTPVDAWRLSLRPSGMTVCMVVTSHTGHAMAVSVTDEWATAASTQELLHTIPSSLLLLSGKQTPTNNLNTQAPTPRMIPATMTAHIQPFLQNVAGVHAARSGGGKSPSSDEGLGSFLLLNL